MAWHEFTGIPSLSRASRDVRILLAQKFFRMLAYGQTMLILVLFFQELGIEETRIGLFMTLTLLGDVVISYVLTFYADTIGRRSVLVIGSVAMAVSGAVFATMSNYWVLLGAAVIGVISPSGDEIGPFRAVEESTLAHLTDDDDRSDMFAWQGIVGTLGSALGSLSAGTLGEVLHSRYGLSRIDGYRIIFCIYGGLAVVKLVLSLMLSAKCEENEVAESDVSDASPDPSETSPLIGATVKSAGLTDYTKSIILKLAIVFCMDSLAYGFMPNSWLVEYFVSVFGVSEATLGTLLFTTNMIGSMTSMASSVLCKRIGSIPAIVVTKLPSALFMGLVPLSQTAWPAMLLIMGRAWTDTMDVVPRQVFLSTLVPSTDRTKVMGIVNVVKTLARAVGPVFAGYFAEQHILWVSFEFVAVLEAAFAGGLVVLFGRGS